MVSPKGRAGSCKVAAEWYADGCVVADEAAVVVGEAQERSELFDVGRRWPVLDGHKLLGIHLNAVLADDVSQELNFALHEVALGQLGVKLMLA